MASKKIKIFIPQTPFDLLLSINSILVSDVIIGEVPCVSFWLKGLFRNCRVVLTGYMYIFTVIAFIF